MQMVPEQTARVSPTLIMVNQLLALSSLELQQMVHAEIEENPALESVENTTCISCGAGTTGLYCPVCMQRMMPRQESQKSGSKDVDDGQNGTADGEYDYDSYRPSKSRNSNFDEEEYDPLAV